MAIFRAQATTTTMKTFSVAGFVVKGFGRGSKELGIPTGKFLPNVSPSKNSEIFVLANLDEDTVAALPPDLATGIYYGWAQLIDKNFSEVIYPMVMSIGWNPFYKNEKKSAVSPTLRSHNFMASFYFRKFISFTSLKMIFMAYR
jgi:riboflavin kinase